MLPKAEYDVCLSFAGEERPYAERVADALRKGSVTVFYDAYEEVNLWGKDLYQHLSAVYQNAKYCVVFLSEAYARKLWTRHELRAAQARAFEESREYILPARFDDTEIPGILSTVMYVDLRQKSPEQLASMVIAKLGASATSAEPTPNLSNEIYEPVSTRPPWKSFARLHALRYRVSEPLDDCQRHKDFVDRLVSSGKWRYKIGVGEPVELLLAEERLEDRLRSFARELREAAAEIDAEYERTKLPGIFGAASNINQPVTSALLAAAAATDSLRHVRTAIRKGVTPDELVSTQHYQQAAAALTAINEAIRSVDEEAEMYSNLFRAYAQRPKDS